MEKNILKFEFFIYLLFNNSRSVPLMILCYKNIILWKIQYIQLIFLLLLLTLLIGRLTAQFYQKIVLEIYFCLGFKRQKPVLVKSIPPVTLKQNLTI